MQEIDLTIFATMKTILICLLIAYLVILVVTIVLRCVSKGSFRAGRFHSLANHNLKIIGLFFVAVLICYIIGIFSAHGLTKVAYSIAEDGANKNPVLDYKSFYVGFSELKNNFENIRKLSMHQQSLAAKLIIRIKESNVKIKNQGKSTKRSGKMIQQSLKNESNAGLISSTWKKMIAHFGRNTHDITKLTYDDIELCTRAIDRVNYIEKRYVTSIKTLGGKLNALFIMMLLALPVLVLSMVLYIRSMARSAATKSGGLNISLVKRLHVLMICSLITFVAGIVIAIPLAGFKNAVFASWDILKTNGLKTKEMARGGEQICGDNRHLVDLWVADFRDILRMSENGISDKRIEIIDLFGELQLLKDTKDILIQKVYDDLNRSTFGGLFRLQQEQLMGVLELFTSVIMDCLVWISVVGFGHQFLTVLFLI